MRYSYEFQIKCVQMYPEGVYLDTLKGISARHFSDQIQNWVRMEEAQGPNALRYKKKNKN